MCNNTTLTIFNQVPQIFKDTTWSFRWKISDRRKFWNGQKKFMGKSVIIRKLIIQYYIDNNYIDN